MTPTESLTLATLFERYLNHVQARGTSKKSYDEKRRVYRRFFKHFSPMLQVMRVRYAAIEAYLDKMAAQSGHKANRHRLQIVAAYNWGIKSFGLPSPNPWKVERYRHDIKPRYVPPVEDFWRVCDVAEPMERRLLLTLLNTAGRKNEILGLEWVDVDFKEGRVRLWTNKRRDGREGDWIPMTTELRAVLERQRLETAFQQWVFMNQRLKKPFTWFSGLMPRLCEAAGVKRFGFHAVRHLSASIMARAGVPVPIIKAILRHKDLTTTTRYLQSLHGVGAVVGDVFSRQKKDASELRSEASISGEK